MKKDPLLFHIMLKQGITWFTFGTQETVGNNIKETINDNIAIYQMTCVLKPECNFLFRYFRCLLPIETMEVDVKIKRWEASTHSGETRPHPGHILQPLEYKTPSLSIPN